MPSQHILSFGSMMTLFLPTVALCDRPSRAAHDLAKESPTQVREEVIRAVETTASEVQRVMEDIEESRDIDDIKARIKGTLREAQQDAKYYAELSRELTFEKEKLEREKQQLQERRNVLEQDRQELNREKRLYSMGFYASASTVLVGVIGLIARFPLNKLERELRRLELLEREHELRQNGILPTTDQEQEAGDDAHA